VWHRTASYPPPVTEPTISAPAVAPEDAEDTLSVSRITSRRGGAFLAVVATGIATQGVTALSGPFQARMLGPYGRGQMVLVLLVALMCSQLGVGGLPAAIAHEVGRSGRPARDVVRSQLRRWLLLSPLPGIVAALAVALLLHSSASNWWAFSGLGFAITTVYLLQSVLYAMVQGERNVARINIFHMAGLSLYTLCVISLYVFDRTDHPLVLIGVLTGCVTLGLGVGCLMLQRPLGDAPDNRHERTLRDFARRSWMSGVGLLDSLGLDILLVGILLGETQVGLYAVAVSATNVTTIVLGGLAQVLLPRLAAAPSAQVAAGMLRRWVMASIAIALLCVLGLEAIIGPAIRFAFGSRFVSIIGCAHILVVSWGFLGFRRVLTSVIQSQDRAGYASTVEVLCLALMLTGVVGLGSAIGLDGVAYSVGGAGIVSCIFLALGIKWHPTEPHVLPTPAHGSA
jgi:enterobacterial common antigen flippase